MNSSSLASGDNSNSSSPRCQRAIMEQHNIIGEMVDSLELNCTEKITPQLIDENEFQMKERIAQCKNIIQTLKLQLKEEKEKMLNEKKIHEFESPKTSGYKTDADCGMQDMATHYMEDYGHSSMYSASVESKLYGDQNLIEYEKQLQKYQNTLTMAQNEKKNAIRKQMLAKAFKLKLMEVENQCNIELLRVKQSLQCLEPLQIIANKWKTSSDENIYDINNFELIPNFCELRASSGSDIEGYKCELEMKTMTESGTNLKDDSLLSD